MAMYVCGDCGSKFQTEQELKGCPICSSDKITVMSMGISMHERIKMNKKICNEHAE